MPKRIAVIGSGISGLVSSHFLSEHHDVTLFEANDYLGGHTHTVPVEMNGNMYSIDTGFIVFNKKTYPQFCKLLEKLNVPIQRSEMSFSYRSDEKDLEYNGHDLNSLFADRRNLIKPDFYYFIKEILRFNKDAKHFLVKNNNEHITIKEYIEYHRYSRDLIDSYLIPMMASIWSKKKEDVFGCSANFILHFYANHGLLNTFSRPDWYVVTNGSKNYIPPLIKKFKDQIYLNTKIECIDRKSDHVILKSVKDEYIFDKVVIATHSDQALALLANPTNEERHLLSAIPYTDNDVILHTDTRIMPKQLRAWASWNYFDNGSSLPTLTYYMNRLQSINSPEHFFISMNLTERIDQNKIIQRFKYAHPCFSQNTLKATDHHTLINGKHNTYFAGSYWGYGFHEDGVNSAFLVCQHFGLTP